MDNYSNIDVKIYILSDKNSVPFYVGRTVCELDKRLYNHIMEAKVGRSHNNKYKIRKIKELGFDIKITQIDKITVFCDNRKVASRMANSIEKEWIAKYLGMGYVLCNRVHGNNPLGTGEKRLLKF